MCPFFFKVSFMNCQNVNFTPKNVNKFLVFFNFKYSKL